MYEIKIARLYPGPEFHWKKLARNCRNTFGKCFRILLWVETLFAWALACQEARIYFTANIFFYKNSRGKKFLIVWIKFVCNDINLLEFCRNEMLKNLHNRKLSYFMFWMLYFKMCFFLKPSTLICLAKSSAIIRQPTVTCHMCYGDADWHMKLHSKNNFWS